MRQSHALLRHVRACRNATLPGSRRLFHLAGTPVGWVTPETAAALTELGVPAPPHGLDHPDPATLPSLARDLQRRTGFRWRDEAFDVRHPETGAPLATIDRGALPLFGLEAWGAHVNGIVRLPSEPHLWVARRAANRPLDAGKLDHLAAGGIAAGQTPRDTAIRELGEEAAIPESLAATLHPAGTLAYTAERPEGLRRDRLHLFDLTLPDTTTPTPRDGEVETFHLWPASQILHTLRTTDDFKFNVALVLLDWLLRENLVDGAEAAALRAELYA